MHAFDSDSRQGISKIRLEIGRFPMVPDGQPEPVAPPRLTADGSGAKHTPPRPPSATRVSGHIHPWIFSPPLPPHVSARISPHRNPTRPCVALVLRG